MIRRRLGGRTGAVQPLFAAPAAACMAALAFAGAVVSCAPPSEQRAAHHRVDIRSLAFEPARADVSPGDTVTWTNRDIVPHTVTGRGADPGQPGSGSTDPWTSDRLDPGESFTLVVGEGTDSLPYLCQYHPTMTGTLVGRE